MADPDRITVWMSLTFLLLGIPDWSHASDGLVPDPVGCFERNTEEQINLVQEIEQKYYLESWTNGNGFPLNDSLHQCQNHCGKIAKATYFALRRNGAVSTSVACFCLNDTSLLPPCDRSGCGYQCGALAQGQCGGAGHSTKHVSVMTVCTAGHYGSSTESLCDKHCHCIGSVCLLSDGVCPTGECQLGWMGQACDQEVNHGSSPYTTTVVPEQSDFRPGLLVLEYGHYWIWPAWSVTVVLAFVVGCLANKMCCKRSRHLSRGSKVPAREMMPVPTNSTRTGQNSMSNPVQTQYERVNNDNKQTTTDIPVYEDPDGVTEVPVNNNPRSQYTARALPSAPRESYENFDS